MIHSKLHQANRHRVAWLTPQPFRGVTMIKRDLSAENSICCPIVTPHALAPRSEKSRREPCHPSLRNRRNRTGLTLVELLVVLAVTSAIFIGFGAILSATKKVVTGSQAMMRANTKADAIARVIRKDMRRVTKSGFLALWTDANGRQKLVFTLAGPLQNQAYQHGTSASSGVKTPLAMAGVVIYGSSQNANTNSPGDILVRMLRVFDPGNTGDGIVTADLSQYQTLTYQQLTTNPLTGINSLLTGFPPDNHLRVPPLNTMDSVNKLWMVLTAGVQDLEITYANEAAAGNNILYSDPTIEDYKTWSHHNQNDWPRLIRFRFKILDKAMPDDLRGKVYEVITTVGQ